MPCRENGDYIHYTESWPVEPVGNHQWSWINNVPVPRNSVTNPPIFAVKNFTVLDSAWLPLIVTMDCDFLSIVNQDGKRMIARTKVDDATTEWSIASEMQEGFVATPRALPKPRWAVGDIVCYVKSVDAGASTVILKMVL